MYEKELNIAFETAHFMEQSLTPEITGEHEIYMDFAVNSDGVPYVTVTVSGRDGVEKLSKFFGDAIRFQTRDCDPVSVAVIVKELQPMNRLN